MDADTLKVLLTVGGAVAELIGLTLVVLDARDARRQPREVRRRDIVVRLSLDPPIHPVASLK